MSALHGRPQDLSAEREDAASYVTQADFGQHLSGGGIVSCSDTGGGTIRRGAERWSGSVSTGGGGCIGCSVGVDDGGGVSVGIVGVCVGTGVSIGDGVCVWFDVGNGVGAFVGCYYWWWY